MKTPASCADGVHGVVDAGDGTGRGGNDADRVTIVYGSGTIAQVSDTVSKTVKAADGTSLKAQVSNRGTISVIGGSVASVLGTRLATGGTVLGDDGLRRFDGSGRRRGHRH